MLLPAAAAESGALGRQLLFSIGRGKLRQDPGNRHSVPAFDCPDERRLRAACGVGGQPEGGVWLAAEPAGEKVQQWCFRQLVTFIVGEFKYGVT